MPLNFTGAYSSKITKRSSDNSSKRALGTVRPTAGSSARSPRSRPKHADGKTEVRDSFVQQLSNVGIIFNLRGEHTPHDVQDLLVYIRCAAFDDVPDRRSGMSSERIAAVLNFRMCLPPIVTVEHVHALSSSSTEADRNIADLAQRGFIRKVALPGLGRTGIAGNDGLVLLSDWEHQVRSCHALGQSAKG